MIFRAREISGFYTSVKHCFAHIYSNISTCALWFRFTRCHATLDRSAQCSRVPSNAGTFEKATSGVISCCFFKFAIKNLQHHIKCAPFKILRLLTSTCFLQSSRVKWRQEVLLYFGDFGNAKICKVFDTVSTKCHRCHADNFALEVHHVVHIMHYACNLIHYCVAVVQGENSTSSRLL